MPSEYIVFADETGTLDPKNRDPSYPVFGLTLAIIKRSDYAEINKCWTDFRLQFFNDPTISLRSYDLRKPSGKFSFLINPIIRNVFFKKLEELIEKTPFKLISAGVRKDQLGPEYRRAYSLYDIVLGLTLERLQSFLETKECSQNETPIVFESRGRKEDRILQNEFDALVNNSGLARTGSLFRLENCKFSFLCCDKSAAMTGLQIADLCAYPIGRYVFDSGTKYLPFQQISNRLIGFGTSDQSDGLRIFPFK